MNRPIDPLQLNRQPPIMRCVFCGCDRWTFTRWCGAISRSTEASYTLFPSGSTEHRTISSNANLLRLIAQQLPSNSLVSDSLPQTSYSCAIIDLPFEDFDADVFRDLKRLIEWLKTSSSELIVKPQQFSSPSIVVCLSESRLSASDWITGLGANLVVDRFARIDATVQRLIETAPRVANSQAAH